MLSDRAPSFIAALLLLAAALLCGVAVARGQSASEEPTPPGLCVRGHQARSGAAFLLPAVNR